MKPSRKTTERRKSRKPAGRARPKPKLPGDLVEQARLALTAGSRMTAANAQAALVLYALGRALRLEHAASLGKLASAARATLDLVGEPVPGEAAVHDGVRGDPDWSSEQDPGVGVDDLTHRRFVVQSMSEMLEHQRTALARTDARRPPPLPAPHMAAALSRMLGSGPLRNLYSSARSPEQDGDAERILAAWSDFVAANGCIQVGQDHAALARKLVVRALVALGVPRKTALDGLVRGARATLGEAKGSTRRKR